MNPLTRRQVLSAGTGIGIALGIGPVGGRLADAAVQSRPRPTAPLRVAVPYGPTAPYTLSAHCNLSQDYFVTKNVAVKTSYSGSILPVVRSDGSQAILVVPQGAPMTLVAPDPKSPSGYVATALPALQPVMMPGSWSGTSAVAGPDNSIIVAYMGGPIGNVRAATATIAADGTVRGPVPMDNSMFSAVDLTQVRTVVGPDSRAFTVAATDQWLGVRDAASTGRAGTRRLLGVPSLSLEKTEFAITGSAAEPALVLVTSMKSQLGLATGPVSGSSPLTVQPIELPAEATVDRRGVLAPPLPMPLSGHPDAVAAIMWLAEDGQAWVATCSATGELVTPPVQLLSNDRYGVHTSVNTASWLRDPSTPDTVTAFLLTDDGTVYKQSVTFTADVPDSAPIPLDQGAEQMAVPSRGLTPDTFLTLARQSTEVPGELELSGLSRRGDGVWASAPLHTSAPAHHEINTYRTLITVADALGTPVPDWEVSITPDQDVLAFRTTGGVVLPAGSETRLKTDRWGQVCIAEPATSLTAGTLKVVAAGPGSRPPATLVIKPDAEVHDFLAGRAPLNQYATVKDLITHPDNTAFSNLGGDPAAVDTVAKAINSAVLAGLSPKTAPEGDLTTFALTGLAAGQPVLRTNVAAPQGRVAAPRWWTDLENDIESVWQAIERGVAQVTGVVSHWDGKQWLMNLTLKLKNGVTAVVNYVVDGVKAAIAAVHGILRAIGAAVEKVIDYLRNLIDAIMEDTKHIADTLYSWISYDPKNPGTQGLAAARNAYEDLITSIEKSSGSFFKGLEDDVRKQISSIARLAPNTSIGEAQSRQPPPKFKPAAKPSQNSRATWLFEKTRSTPVFSSSTTLRVSDESRALAPVIGNAASKMSMTGPGAAAAALPAINSPKDALDLDLTTFVEVILNVVADGIELLDEVIHDILEALRSVIDDLNAVVRYNLADVPLLGDLLRLFGITDLSLGKLLCLVLGFGVAVIGDLVYGGNSWLPKPVKAKVSARAHALPAGRAASTSESGEGSGEESGEETEEPSWLIFITLTKMVTDAFSEVPTAFTIAEVLSDEDEEEVNKALEATEIIFSIVENTLFFPFAEVTAPTLEWRAKQESGDDPLGNALLPWMGGYAPSVFKIIGLVIPEKEVAKAYRKLGQPILTSVTGCLGMAASIYASVEDRPSEGSQGELAIAILIDIFRWLPSALSCLIPIPEANLVWAGAAVGSPIALIALDLAELLESGQE